MLDHLHKKAAQTLGSVDSVMLSSFGPPGIQISRVTSTSDDLTLFVFIPRSSDQLLNLEHRQDVVVSVDDWELQGTARLLTREEIPLAIRLSGNGINDDNSVFVSNQTWGRTVEIRPTRLTFHSSSGQCNIETIDFYARKERQ
jgi:hypothetical protein